MTTNILTSVFLPRKYHYIDGSTYEVVNFNWGLYIILRLEHKFSKFSISCIYLCPNLRLLVSICHSYLWRKTLLSFPLNCVFNLLKCRFACLKQCLCQHPWDLEVFMPVSLTNADIQRQLGLCTAADPQRGVLGAAWASSASIIMLTGLLSPHTVQSEIFSMAA